MPHYTSGYRRLIRPLAHVGLAAGLALVISTPFLWHRTYRTPTPAGVVPAATANPLPAAGTGATRPTGTATRDRAGTSAGGRPVRLRIPALSVDAPIAAEDVAPTGALGVPDDPAVVGWWQGSAKPGAAHGTVVLDGHVDTNTAGAGALYRLETLAPESRLSLQTNAGPVEYRMVARAVYRKTALPAELFAAYGQPRLALITCGGPFDSSTGHYLYNVVVYAVPVGTSG